MSIHTKKFLLNGDTLTVSFDEETKEFEASISVKGIKPKNEIPKEIKKAVESFIDKSKEEKEEKEEKEDGGLLI